MKTVYSPLHNAHVPEMEFFRGNLVECFEKPDRALRILREVRRRHLGEVVLLPHPNSLIQSDDGEVQFVDSKPIDPGSDLIELLGLVHEEGYINFVRTIFQHWRREVPMQSYALPHAFNRLGRNDKAVELMSPYAKLGYYSFDACTPITAGTWNAAVGSAWCAVRGQEIVREEGMAFALCRPPGHHAHRSMCGGYCFFNNAAVAAEALLRYDPTACIAILDVDYHHGNGTQSIFYERREIFFVSIHGNPINDYPYFLGYPDETGGGNARGWNANFPLPHNTQWPEYARTLDKAIEMIQGRNPRYLIVSLGVDTFRKDPISKFLLESEDFMELGRRIGVKKWPTLFVMEGGYHDEIGINVVNVLKGFQEAYLGNM